MSEPHKPKLPPWANVQRQNLAGLALMGIVSNSTWNTESLRMLGVSESQTLRIAAKLAAGYADALLAELNKPQEAP